MSVYIIAEAGVNHDGRRDQALRLVDAAADAGADAVKFQTFRPDELVAPQTPKAAYQAEMTGAAESQLDMLRRLALTEGDYCQLSEHCRAKAIDFLSSPFDVDSLDFLVDRLDMRAIKIPSGEIVNGPLLLRAARKGRRILLSTGMSTLSDIERALEIIAFGLMRPDGYPTPDCYRSAAGKAAVMDKVVLLQCTSEYPTPAGRINLRAMATLQKAFGLRCGLSDHSIGITVPIAAAALGAAVIEKHITLDRTLPGPDHRASLEPSELAEMVCRVREATEALGNGEKRPNAAELETAKVVRRVLIAAQPIAKGAHFSEANLASRRASGGRSPIELWSLLGRPASRAYSAGEIIGE